MAELDIKEPAVAEMLDDWRQGAGKDWKAIFRQRMESHRLIYEGKRNPLDAWSVVLLARALGEAPPDWVMSYLAICATGFHDLQLAAVQNKKIEPVKIATVLGMVSRGRGTVFSERADVDWMAMGQSVLQLVRGGHQETYAIDAVAEEYRFSPAKVRRAWKRFQQEMPEECSK